MLDIQTGFQVLLKDLYNLLSCICGLFTILPDFFYIGKCSNKSFEVRFIIISNLLERKDRQIVDFFWCLVGLCWRRYMTKNYKEPVMAQVACQY